MFGKNGIFGGISGFLLLSWLIWHFNGWMTDYDAKTLPVYETDAASLVQKFADNEPGASAELEGKRIAVTGIITDFDMTFDTPSVTIQGIHQGWSNNDVVVNLADKSTAMNLHKGDNVTLVGVEPSVTMGSVFLKSGRVYSRTLSHGESDRETATRKVEINVDCKSITENILLVQNGKKEDTWPVMEACGEGSHWAVLHYADGSEAPHLWSSNEMYNESFHAGLEDALKQIHSYLKQ